MRTTPTTPTMPTTLNLPSSSSPSSAAARPRSGRSAVGLSGAGPGPVRLRAEEGPAAAAFDATAASGIEADLAQLNLSFLHVARELSRSARDVAITRLGLDAAACAALCRLSVADLQALAHSQALIFGLRLDPADLPLQAQLARTNRVASEARVLLSANPG